jgi:hypothetical protein
MKAAESEAWLSDPHFWELFSRRITWGDDSAYDASMFKSLSEAVGIPEDRLQAKFDEYIHARLREIATHSFPAPHTIN